MMDFTDILKSAAQVAVTPEGLLLVVALGWVLWQGRAHGAERKAWAGERERLIEKMMVEAVKAARAEGELAAWRGRVLAEKE